MPRRNWTEAEIEQALLLYLRTTFGRIHSRNSEIIGLARILDRTPSAVALKMTNLANIDDTLDRKGMSHVSDLDRFVWSNFFEKLRSTARDLPDEVDQPNSHGLGETHQANFNYGQRQGIDVNRLTSVRQGQHFFRQMVLSSYENRCGVTGISQPELLIAGHIRPWSLDKDNRMNPRNGICLNRLHDKAFENKLISFAEDGSVLYSTKLEPITKEKMRRMSNDRPLQLPKRFKPSAEFIREHREQMFLE